MNTTCPECKNEIDLSSFAPLEKDAMVECEMCGISLMVTNIDGDTVEVEVADEGK